MEPPASAEKPHYGDILNTYCARKPCASDPAKIFTVAASGKTAAHTERSQDSHSMAAAPANSAVSKLELQHQVKIPDGAQMKAIWKKKIAVSNEYAFKTPMKNTFLNLQVLSPLCIHSDWTVRKEFRASATILHDFISKPNQKKTHACHQLYDNHETFLYG